MAWEISSSNMYNSNPFPVLLTREASPTNIHISQRSSSVIIIIIIIVVIMYYQILGFFLTSLVIATPTPTLPEKANRALTARQETSSSPGCNPGTYYCAGDAIVSTTKILSWGVLIDDFTVGVFSGQCSDLDRQLCRLLHLYQWDSVLRMWVSVFY